MQRDWHDDLTFFETSVVQIPRAPFIHHGLGLAFVAHNRLPDALRELTIAVQLNPKDYEALFVRGVIEGHLANNPEAVRNILQSIMLQPRRPPRVYVTLANYADAAGRHDLSEAALTHAEAMEGGVKLAQITRAQIELRHGQNGAALRLLQGLAAKYPDDAEVWSILGSARVASRDYPGALAAYRRLIVLAPDFSEPYYREAQVLHLMGRDYEALANCQSALRVNPGDPATRALMATIRHHG